MPFVPDNHPELNALLDGALEADADSGDPERTLAADEGPARADWLILADWLDDHSDPRAALIRLAVADEIIGQREWVDRQVSPWLGKLPRGVKIAHQRGVPGLTLSLSPKAVVPPAVAAAVAAGWLEINECHLPRHLPQIPGLRRLRLPAGSTDDDLAALANHPTLQALDLFNSHGFTFTGFYHVASCSQLTSLAIDRAPWLRDADLEVLMSCHHLRNLRLRRCHALNGGGPGRLTGLRLLRFRTCTGLTAEGLGKLHSLKDLERLEIDSDIGGGTLAGMPDLPGVTSLNLSGCDRINDAGLVCLSRLPRLESLHLNHCVRLSGKGLADLAEPETLRVLCLRGGKQVTDAGLAALARCTGLVELQLPYCTAVTDASLAYLAGARGLRTLNLSGCAITGSGLGSLNAPLETLELRNCPITDNSLALLGRLPTLREVILGSCQRLTGDGLTHLARLPDLQTLSLSMCDNLTEAGLQNLARLPKLHSLDLRNRGRLGNTALAPLAHLHRLRVLTLSGAETLTGAGLAAIANLRELISLDLSSCRQVTDADLVYLTGLCSLQELVLSCVPLTDAGIDHLVRLANLRTLHLQSGYQSDTRLSLDALARLAVLTNLRTLWLGSCGYGRELDRLRAQLPGCNVWGW